ncbi:hypothetical protein VCRA2130O400_460034 [Vibrio crassostreae]|nr:hypothetical protein VCRA2119O381_410031 [Vibrio crassostreae]CAK2507768.1 hypothetical protein VCRA2113O360_40141 [Vibrio crassostreae]CAK2919641.1 hypothetical protein VCRA2119O383_30140 [Vibrio crassostreae]CAK3970115.1 hypothetical protein VCRA2130O400_460034 [Vibrio crassostreae]
MGNFMPLITISMSSTIGVIDVKYIWKATTGNVPMASTYRLEFQLISIIRKDTSSIFFPSSGEAYAIVIICANKIELALINNAAVPNKEPRYFIFLDKKTKTHAKNNSSKLNIKLGKCSGDMLRGSITK